jgi:topoisomerase-4 subunit A
MNRGDQIIAIYKNGSYEITEYDQNNRYNYADLIHIAKYHPGMIVSAIYYEGEKGWSMAKRFEIETSTLNSKFNFITEHKDSKLYYATTHPNPEVLFTYKRKKEKIDEILTINEFVDVKGWKAIGNKIEDLPLVSVVDQSNEVKASPKSNGKSYKAGDKIEFDL